MPKKNSKNIDEFGKPPKENIQNESWWDTHRKNLAQLALTAAKELIQEAETAICQKRMDVAEDFYKKSLVKIREALLWEPEENAYSKYLHEVGRRVHDIFRCELEFEDGMYMVTCPVMLSHCTLGFSIGGSAKSICSICGKNVFDCPHVKGQSYDDVLAKRYQGICNICGQKECEHKEGERYDEVRAFAMIREFDLDHISIVDTPANPLCVIQSFSLLKSEILERLPKTSRDQFVYGKTIVYCNHCLICEGT